MKFEVCFYPTCHHCGFLEAGALTTKDELRGKTVRWCINCADKEHPMHKSTWKALWRRQYRGMIKDLSMEAKRVDKFPLLVRQCNKEIAELQKQLEEI